MEHSEPCGDCAGRNTIKGAISSEASTAIIRLSGSAGPVPLLYTYGLQMNLTISVVL